MLRYYLLVMLLLTTMLSLTYAQDTSDTAQADADNNAPTLTVRVLFESAFVRALPNEASEPVASVFENDILEAIGRNADGMWVQVRRPGREISLGWIARRLLVINFDMTRLPLSDNETGITGNTPIIDTGYAIFILTEANVRAEPFNGAPVLTTIPTMATVPALERNPDTRWVKVNYLGTVGWVSAFNFNSRAQLDGLAIAPETQRALANIEIIPPAVQIAQVYRLRAYVQPLYDTSQTVATFWDQLLQGQTRRCNPPSGNYAMITITPRDIVELPELRQASRLLPRALDDLNTSIETMHQCGVYTPQELNRAYAQSINARVIFRSTLSQLETVEALLLPQLGAEQSD